MLHRTYNDPGEGDNFINGTGAVDLYGFVSVFTPYSDQIVELYSRALQDSYPQGTTSGCFDPDSWTPVTTDYRSYHLSANPAQPLYMPEFQGQAFFSSSIFCLAVDTGK